VLVLTQMLGFQDHILLQKEAHTHHQLVIEVQTDRLDSVYIAILYYVNILLCNYTCTTLNGITSIATCMDMSVVQC
jgi:hypothetical protein